MEIGIRVHNGNETEHLSPEKIKGLAAFYELDTLIPHRYTSLLVVNLYLLDKVSGISPEQVINEIKSLEGLAPSQQTKPATEFRGSLLKGLWHKHFLPALPSAFAHNILNHFGKDGLAKLVEEVFDPVKSSTVTREMIDELSHRVVEESIVDRGAAEKLTGEWIIFAKEDGMNYYLCISPHASGDENIANHVKVCAHEFPFLSKYAS
ncbi:MULTISPECIES: hypothetical protein [Stenotrophomonas]|uniref:hypothetical protein n=1 Tax=Stenotrophomonas TaxID=40323 RepID=UPI0013052449|nr:hypothetical protein [Stenotrophomonas maltophilia]MBA2130566.1 hypothetical protein [Stenotrophomonas maltophilia]MBH1680511.1 hypothetical protein [Stenotrophomonas maltophilia]MBH1873285.1 hypothetical protein [Stenotrophomonas maltophilia]